AIHRLTVSPQSPHTWANRENWNTTSRAYQKSHRSELEDDVLWGPSMPPERELKILGSDVADKDVLEIACGGGQSAVYLAEQGARVTGVDFSSAQLAHARAFAKAKKVQVRFIESNVEDLSMLADSSFDIAFSAYALGFVEDILGTEPLPKENTYADVFPLEKIRMIPGTTIWRARRPKVLEF